MAKRTVKPPKEAVTLGMVMRDFWGDQVRFTFASKMARLTPQNELEHGYILFEKHLADGNIVQSGNVGLFPGVPTYRIEKPDAPALI